MKPDPAAGAGGHRRHDRLRTGCGRELTIGRLALGDARYPAARVFVDLGECSGCRGSGWAGLTVAEARQLARAVLAQAAAAERECQAHAAGAAGGRQRPRSRRLPGRGQAVVCPFAMMSAEPLPRTFFSQSVRFPYGRAIRKWSSCRAATTGVS